MNRRYTLYGTLTLSRFNLKRGFTSIYGLLYLAIGIFIPILITTSLLLTKAVSNSEPSVVTTTIGDLIPAFIPLSASIGGIGVSYLFSTDRSGGVYEYLIATGKIRIGDIFLSFAMVSIIMVSVILAVDISVIYTLIHFLAPFLQGTVYTVMAVFSVPVAYISSLLSIIAMLTWASMSRVYPGVNAPGGIGSIIGIIPPLVFLLVIARIFHPSDIVEIAGIFSAVLFVLLIVILSVAIRRMSNERMLA